MVVFPSDEHGSPQIPLGVHQPPPTIGLMLHGSPSVPPQFAPCALFGQYAPGTHVPVLPVQCMVPVTLNDAWHPDGVIVHASPSWHGPLVLPLPLPVPPPAVGGPCVVLLVETTTGVLLAGGTTCRPAAHQYVAPAVEPEPICA